MQKINSTSPIFGYGLMALACFLFTLMSAAVYQAHLSDAQLGSMVSSFVRVSVNLVMVLLIAYWGREGMGTLWGDLRPSLWLRGVFGSTSLLASFAAIHAIGIAEASFLHSTNAIFIALLAPWVLGQKNSWLIWVAVIGGLMGVGLILQPRFEDLFPWGRAAGLTAGLGSALAYLMVAKSGRSNPANTVIFYFCIIAFGIHLALFLVWPPLWPQQQQTWLLLILAGVLAGAAQQCMTLAYQLAPASRVALISYLGPVFSLILSSLLFAKHPDQWSLLGALMVVSMGITLAVARQIKLKWWHR